MASDLLSQAQVRLEMALGRARAGEDRELAQKVREGGESLAHLFAGLLKMSRVHKATNHAFDAPVAELVQALDRLVTLLGTVHLVAVEDQIYVNELRIRTEGQGSAKDLGSELARHNVGGVDFHAALDAEQVRQVVAAFSGKPGEARRRELQRALAEAGIRSVELTPRYRFRLQGEDPALDRVPGEGFRHALRLIEETYDHVAAGRVLNPLPLRRAVVDMLEQGPGAPELWEQTGEGLPHAAHAGSVALLALLIGKAIGLRNAVLQDLGLAALLHDVGYASLPPEIAAGPEGLQRHPVEGARQLLRQHGFHEAKLRRLRAVLDHHRDHADPRSQPSLLGEILHLAEDYTTLQRLWKARISPADALGAIARTSEEIYHPALVQLMVNALGRYPPGTLLELADGRMGRSVSPVRSPETFAQPIVRLLVPGTSAPADERVDLALGGSVRRVLPG
jgi:hypothetical protein